MLLAGEFWGYWEVCWGGVYKKLIDPSSYGSPLILDLDGGGLDLINIEGSSTYFDIDNDGFAEQIGWVGPGDGFLALDRNGDGKINDVSELFGAGIVKPSVSIPVPDNESGFASLAEFDENGDGVIDITDAVYSDLLIWRDFNGDGHSSPDEVVSLLDAGVASIDLNAAAGSGEQEGNIVAETSTFTRTDGTVGEISDVWFKYNPTITQELDVPAIDEDVKVLPFVIGLGEVSNLDVAMQRDPLLKEMLEELTGLTVSDIAVYTQKVEAIILRWHGVDNVLPDSRGAFVDAQHIAAIEKLQGFEFRQRSSSHPRPHAGAAMEENWRNYLSNIAMQLLTQISLGDVLAPGIRDAVVMADSFKRNVIFANALGEVAGLASVEDLENGIANTIATENAIIFADALSAAAALAPIELLKAVPFWHGVSVLYGGIVEELDLPVEDFIAQFDVLLGDANINFTYADFERMIVGSDGDDLIIGRSSDAEEFSLSGGKDIIFGGEGDDTLVGGGGGLIPISLAEGWVMILLMT